MFEKKDSRLEADPLFLVEYMKATITSDIFTVMEEKSISKTELANRLGKSRQYVSRILNETANFGEISITSGGIYKTFLAKMDANGNWLWATKTE